MTEKQAIKQSEAKILIYLSVVHNTRKHVTAIAGKLNMDYSYVMRVLQGMISKGWLMKHQVRRHMFYDLTRIAPLQKAQEAYFSVDLQRDLESYRQEDLTAQIAKESATEATSEEGPVVQGLLCACGERLESEEEQANGVCRNCS